MDKILAATDLSARSDRAILRAAQIARAKGASLDIVHVVDDDLPAALLQARSADTEALLHRMVSSHVDLAALGPRIDVEVGRLDRLLPEIARSRGADLMVVGSHRGRGLADLLGAPTVSRLLRGLDIPVLVAVGSPEASYDKVAIGWDFSPAGRAAAAEARRLTPGATLTLVHAWQEPSVAALYPFDGGAGPVAEDIERLEGEILSAAEDLAGPLKASVVIGPAGPVLLRQDEVDLLAVGRHARSGLVRLLLGSTAEAVALAARCDVLIAPPG